MAQIQEKQPRELMAAAMAEYGLTVKSEFVPFSLSRNADEKYRTLNWRITLCHEPADLEPPAKRRAILTCDYSAGMAHSPAHKKRAPKFGHGMTIDDDACEKYEAENGRIARHWPSGILVPGKAILPDPIDVVWSLIQDASVIDSARFEDWAGDFGYDTDSRKAESIYRECLAHAVAIRAAIGDEGMRALQEAGQDY